MKKETGHFVFIMCWVSTRYGLPFRGPEWFHCQSLWPIQKYRHRGYTEQRVQPGGYSGCHRLDFVKAQIRLSDYTIIPFLTHCPAKKNKKSPPG